jgi:hypothetical protein
MITKKRVLVAAIALDLLLLVSVFVLHVAGWYQPDLSVGGVSVPMHDSAYIFANIDENTFISTSTETALTDIVAFYSERLAAMGWLAQPGEHYQDTAQGWTRQGGHEDQRIVYKQLIVFAETTSNQQRYLLVAVGLYLPPTLCGDSQTTVIVRATSAPTASARAAEGFALFGEPHSSRTGEIVAGPKASCSG